MNPRSRQLKILVDVHLASAFNAACKESGVSMTKELSGYMARFVGAAEKRPLQAKLFRIATRRDRRGAMRNIVSILVAVRDAEKAYLDAIPENLCSGPAYEAAEIAVCTMDEAIALLDEAYM